uniref:Aquaporin n=1 Tax=Helix pomatia TaxID=6536 RepID=A0A1I7PJA0_HELPO|nr:aquaporin [Helix pomatia]
MFGIMKESVEDLLSPNLWLALPSEFIGTLIIILLGCGSWTGIPLASDAILRIALTFGLAVGTVVLVFQHISGAHVNPAVTAAALVTRRVSIIRGVLYIIAQVIGGIVGAGILYGLTPSGIKKQIWANDIPDGIGQAQGFGVELIITFVYVLTVFACQDEKRSDFKGSNPLTIGLAAVVCHLFAVPFTRAGMNPARSFGPAVITAAWRNHWIFWVGPVVGGVLAGLLYEYVFAAGATFDGFKKCLLRTKKPKKEQEPDQEKTPLEEVKIEVIEIEDTKVDVEKPQDVVQPEPEKGTAEVVEVNEQEKK